VVSTRRLLALAFLFTGVLAARALPAVGQTADPPAPTTAPAATTASGLDPGAVRVAIDLTRTREKLDAIDREVAVAQARLTSAQAAYDELNTKILTNQTKLVVVKDRVRTRAVHVYQHGGSGNEALVMIGSVDDLQSAETYSSAALGVDDTELADLSDLERTLETQRAARAHELDDLRTTKARLDADHEQLTVLRAQEQALLDKWGAVPVMGDGWLTGPQIAAWFKSTGATARLAPGSTIDDVARLYTIEGGVEHVRGDLAFAQAVIETGSFGVAAGNNYSGIGVCDSCSGGYAFPTPLDGVRAQIQLLRNYADPDSRAANLANAPSPSLYGADPAKAAATYDSFFLKGKAPLWNQMGNGNWATDPTYARKVIELFARMIAYTAAHPA
jgi:hypothetical protein